MARVLPKEGELNRKLHEKQASVFQGVPGFERALCLRRAPTPRGKDPDFLLIQPDAPLSLGIVECEGLDSEPPEGVQQLLDYIARFPPGSGHGKVIHDRCIRAAFEPENKLPVTQRARDNRKAMNGWEGFVKALSPWFEGEDKFKEALDEVDESQIVPILIYYRNEPLDPVHKRALSMAFQNRRFVVGRISTGKQMKFHPETLTS